MPPNPNVIRKKSRPGEANALWVLIDCPACKFVHAVPVLGPKSWTWNGSLVKPTMSPSIKVSWDHGEAREKRCCHFTITHGRIRFENDCTHPMSGQTVELAPVVDGEDPK